MLEGWAVWTAVILLRIGTGVGRALVNAKFVSG
jgi:hypothetical protein